jgi:hypothetical protein
MNAPSIWIGFSRASGCLLWITKVHERRTLLQALAPHYFSLLLQPFPIGSQFFKSARNNTSNLTLIGITGTPFTMGNGDQVFVSLIFLILFLFLSMSFVVDIPIRFVPIGFMLASLFWPRYRCNHFYSRH